MRQQPGVADLCKAFPGLSTVRMDVKGKKHNSYEKNENSVQSSNSQSYQDSQDVTHWSNAPCRSDCMTGLEAH